MKRLLEVRGYSAVSLLSFLRVFSIWVRSVQLLLALFALLILFVVLPSTTQADFAMGAYSQDNSIDEFIDSEKKFDFTYQVIGFTFDTFTETDANHLELAIKKLGNNRVYHVTISPFGYSAKQVAEGEYDAAYRRFFALAKKSEARFIFRTMHEMNGSWYSWSGDPYNFKKAWKRVHEISRKEGIDASKVLFVFSSNSQDLPSENGIINGTMIFCTPAVRAKNNCIAMEDYYPGSEYVDLMGITLYNWGRGKSESWSKWTSFEDLLLEPRMQMFERMKLRGHPIIIDEVGTTAVDFQGTWSNEAVIEAYLHGEKRKNEWIRGMQATLKNHTEIVAAVYFNRDKTYGLMDRSLIGELDWSVSSTKVGKVYTAFFDIFKDATVSTRSLPFLPSYSLTEAKTLASQKAKETLIGIRSYKNNSKKRATMIENIRKKYQVEQTKLDAMGATAKNIKIQTYWKNVLSEYRKIVDAELKSKSK